MLTNILLVFTALTVKATPIKYPFDDYITKRPWSGSYLPTRLGGAAASFVPQILDQLSFNRNFRLGLERVNLGLPHPMYMPQRQMDLLRPSEKYDVLVGNQNWEVTRKIWEAGREVKLEHGSIPKWVGECHGWSPASMLFPKPEKDVILRGIKFTPSDQKALYTHFTATSLIQDRVTLIDSNLGPGRFHREALDRMSAGLGFVLDLKDSGRVNNKPVFGMNSTYTRLTGDAVKVTTVFRYMSEVERKDDIGRDDERFVTYSYVIRVDEKGNVKDGGYWLSEKPDFMWFTPNGEMPWSTQDFGLPEWDGEEIPAEYADASIRAAGFRYQWANGTSDAMPQFLGKVIYKIMKEASK